MKINTLNQLLKLIDKELQGLIQYKSQIESEIQELNHKIDELNISLEQERKWVSKNLAHSSSFEAFYRNITIKKSRLNSERLTKDSKLNDIKSLLHDKYIEQKRYDQLLNKILEEQAAKEAKIENDALDEIGKQRFINRQ